MFSYDKLNLNLLIKYIVKIYEIYINILFTMTFSCECISVSVNLVEATTVWNVSSRSSCWTNPRDDEPQIFAIFVQCRTKKTFRVKRKDASHFPCHSLHPLHPPITAYLYVYNLPPPLLSSRLLASPPPITSSSHDSQTHPFPLRSLLTGRFSLQSESLVWHRWH